MRPLQLIFTAFLTFLFVINAVFWRKAIAILLCGILSFNSTSCYSFLNSDEIANSAEAPRRITDSGLEVTSDGLMVASAFRLEEVKNDHANVVQEESGDIANQKDSTLAFKPDLKGQGHWLITEFSLQGGAWLTPDKKILTDSEGRNLAFTKEAIEEIYQANRGVDLRPGAHYTDIRWEKGDLLPSILPFSDDAYIAEKHFDNELFPQASSRLKQLKNEIINVLTAIKKDSSEDIKTQAGKNSRSKLGQALHTLQDFYAHTNWVELGFKGDEIDERLGRSIIPAPPINMYTSEPVSEAEIATALAAQIAVAKGTKIPNTYVKLASIIGAKVLLQHTPEELASFMSTKPGILNSSLKGTRNRALLTSGYFMNIGLIDQCIVPKKGKTRHGGLDYWCPNGLNKDEEGRSGYGVAQAQAVKATIDYVNQIIYEDPSIKSNISAIKALMGMKEDPCQSKDNQDRDECKLKEGRSTNDPHLVTFDGLKYDLQTVGEVILIKSKHSDFEVQTRQTPWNNSASVSINSAVAIKVESDRVALYAQGLPDEDTTTPLRVNGKPTTIQGNKLALTGGGEILKQGGNYVISAPTGEKVLVSSSGSFLNVSPIVHNRSGKYSGLLGNVNGNPKDDLQVRDGKNVLEARSTYGDVKQVVNLVGLRLPGVLDRAEQVYFDRLYKEFANSWRVKQEESLFDYPAGKTTKSYLNPGFPDKYLTLNMLSADQIQKAQNACTEAKVTEDLMEGCIFDVGFSGFTEFARTTAEISGYIGIVNQLIPGLNIPTPDQVVNRAIEKIKPKVCLPFVGCI